MSEPEYTYNLPPTKEHLLAIGQVIVESSTLEGVLEIAIWKLRNLSYEDGLSITRQLGYRGRKDMFLEAAKEVFTADDDKKHLAHLEKILRKAGEDRNEIIHGYWGWGLKQDSPLFIKYKRKRGEIYPEAKYMKPATVEIVAHNLEITTNEVIRFLTLRGVEPPP